jgi:hypothetical protein
MTTEFDKQFPKPDRNKEGWIAYNSWLMKRVGWLAALKWVVSLENKGFWSRDFWKASKNEIIELEKDNVTNNPDSSKSV